MAYHCSGMDGCNADDDWINEMTDKIDISPEAVAAMLDGVTPGPWEWYKPEYWPAHESQEGDLGSIEAGKLSVCSFGNNTQYYPSEGISPNDADARFIAWAREAVPALSARLAEVEAERDNLRLACRVQKRRAEEAEAIARIAKASETRT